MGRLTCTETLLLVVKPHWGITIQLKHLGFVSRETRKLHDRLKKGHITTTINNENRILSPVIVFWWNTMAVLYFVTALKLFWEDHVQPIRGLATRHTLGCQLPSG